MLVKRRSFMHYILFAFCLTFVNICGALSFGDIKVYSYLDETLSAELELTSLEGLDPSSIIVTLAKPNDFIRYGLQRPYFLTSLLFDVVTYQDKVLVYIRSSKVVKTPYLEFLIDFSWPGGGYIKDYTVLINPPPKNLNSVTRPVPLSLIAVKESEVKSFNNDLQQQAEASENQAQPVKRNIILPGQTTFSDESIYESQGAADAQKNRAATNIDGQNNPAVGANTPSNSGSPATTQAQVPGANAPVTNVAPPVAANLPSANTTSAPILPSVPVDNNSAIVDTMPPDQNQVSTTNTQPVVTSPASSTVNAADPGQNIPVPAIVKPVTPAANIKPGNNLVKKTISPADRSALNYAIRKLKEADAVIGPTTDIDLVAAARKKHLEMYKDIEAVDPDAEIDFGDVIKPKAPGASGVSAVKNPGLSPGVGIGSGPGSAGGNLPSSIANSSSSASNNSLGFSLLLVGFALGVVGVVGFGLKKGWHHKLFVKHVKQDQPNAELIEDQDLDIDIDLDAELGRLGEELHHEEIELSTTADVGADLDLDQIEKEISKLGVGNKTESKHSAVQRGSGKSVSDLLNLGMPKGASVSQNSLIETVKDIAELDEEIKKTNVIPEATPSVLDQLPESAFKFDELEIELSTASIAIEQNDFIETSDPFTPEPKAVPSSDDSIQFTPEPKAVPSSDDSIQFTPEPKAAPSSDDSIKFASEPKAVPSSDDSIQFSSEGVTIPIAEVDEQLQDVVSTSVLHLEVEGTSLLQPGQDPIVLKINLAKQYLGAGDKESARAILMEVIAIAKDAQKLEAEIMLSGIL